uniref:Uncharacterized protein n=1 Tax=Caenorhabditis tropicalis TaxID=1561998 RepID=A0A1I7T8D1_9PELO
MTRYRLVILLSYMMVFGYCQNPGQPSQATPQSGKVPIKGTIDFTHPHQPTFAPCKYGVMKSYGQPHFVVDPTGGNFTTEFECCDTCETLHIILPGTNVPAKMCCLPESTWKHLKDAYDVMFNSTTKKMYKKVVNPLDYVFHKIVPKEMSLKEYRRKESMYQPKTGSGAYGYIFIGAAAAQLIICIFVIIFWYLIPGRIVLECVPDCDYEIEKEIKVVHQSKSLLLSDNMNSDLMSMSVGVS